MSVWTLSFAPLERKLGGSANDMSIKLGVATRQSVQKYRERGVEPRRAEQLAAAAGYRADEIWGEAWRWSDEALLEFRRWQMRRRAQYRHRWPWRDNFEFASHTCASDGCNCWRGRVL